MRPTRSSTITGLLIAGLSAATTLAQTPLGSATTYQGQLKQKGQPVSGDHVMTFALFDAATGGNQVGATLVFDGLGGNPPPVSVAEGLFAVQLDFGAAAFSGDERWLEIAVEGTTLSPRQLLTAAPYALKVRGIDGHSLDAPDGDPVDALAVRDNGNVAIGPITPYAHLTIKGGIGLDALNTNGGDLNTGIRFGDASSGEGLSSKKTSGGNRNGLDFYTANQKRLSVRNTGEVGIGTDSPGYPLTVVGGIGVDLANQNDGTIDHGLRFGEFGSGEGIASRRTGGANQYGLDFYTAGQKRMSLDNLGRVGVGTDAPWQSLTVQGGMAIDSGGFNNGNFLNSLTFGAFGTGEAIGSRRTPGDNQHGLDFYTAGAIRMSVANYGFVGIGTLTPQTPFHLVAGAGNAATIQSADSYGTRLILHNTAPAGHKWSVTSMSSGDLFFEDLSAFRTRMVLSTAGFLGIGTGVPEAMLHVEGESLFNDESFFYGDAHHDAHVKIYGPHTLEMGAGEVKESNAGKIGYGVFTPNALDIVGGGTTGANRTIKFWAEGGTIFTGPIGILTSAPDQMLSIGSGNASKPGGGSWASFSDKRLKKDIQPLSGALDKLMALHGVTFEYVDPASISELPGQRVGMVAQDVEQVFPDWVSEGRSGYKSVTYRGFEALTVEALRDLRAEKDRELGQKDADISRLRTDHDAELRRLGREKDAAIDLLRKEKDAEIAELRARLERIETALLTNRAGGN
ncbi:MAG: tail fiber domain-containing protein [Phycisphaerae bacterium]|nr:MAG: hypothetical protein EDS66_04820 [Planctomycetota bacterium]KAB2949652.1 MAG: hypothetical protein F9K17_02295 [Phycisphaerae bacterium]MBE7456270.1 tail fiber domain-containing protein [Planctomycetia bacterium]MCK6464819.1 tail fiber domain-containing protein [Phycisphaerae bacterium]MCL4718389.1 tail fiber domain-containing protein [Phycisphaerae bacterium]